MNSHLSYIILLHMPSARAPHPGETGAVAFLASSPAPRRLTPQAACLGDSSPLRLMKTNSASLKNNKRVEIHRVSCWNPQLFLKIVSPSPSSFFFLILILSNAPSLKKSQFEGKERGQSGPGSTPTQLPRCNFFNLCLPGPPVP